MKKNINKFEKEHSVNPLDKNEIELMQNIENDDNWASVDNLQDIKKEHQRAAKEFIHDKKAITIRLTNGDILKLKSIAKDEGMPYQTMVSSILHKVATGRIQNVLLKK